MAEIRVRNGTGSEFAFGTVAELADAIRSGGVTATWEVFHSAAQRWLPVTRHPAFTEQSTACAEGGEPA